MKQIPDEKQIEELLANSSLQTGKRLERRLSRAPWTGPAIARRRFASAVSFVALLVALFLAVTPQGRAFAGQFLGFFQTSNQTAFPATPSVQTPVSTSIALVETTTALPASDPGQCGDTISAISSSYVCQLKAAEASLGFNIRVFSKLAAKESLQTDLSFISLAADPPTRSVRLVYSTTKGVNLWLAEGLGDFPKARGPWEIVPQTAVQAAQVGDYPAEYLMGDFVQWAGSQEFTWESNVANTQRLRWREGDRWFEIRSMGGREMSGPFDQADLISLAENLVSISQGVDLLAGTASPGLDERAGFHVREPSVLPKGFQLCFADYDAGYDGPTVFLSYCDGQGNSLVIDQILVDKASPYDFAERWGEPITVTPVQIGSVTGYHAVRGDGIQVVMWEEDGVRIQVAFQWDAYADAGSRIDQAGILSVANSMATGPVGQASLPAALTATAASDTDPDLMELKIDLAERQAGFKLMLPLRLPAGLSSHGGASFNQATGVASVWFTYDDVNMNGLYLNQQIVSNPDDCVLCDAIVGEDNSVLLVHGPEIVGANAGLQTVQIGDITGKYYTGVRLGSGKWDPLPDMKHLRWQANGRAFELISLGTDLQKEDLIGIAEGLK